MHLIPLYGRPDLAFGSTYRNVLEILGQPDSDEEIADVDTHPKGRRSLSYGDFSVTISQEFGVFGMGLWAHSDPIYLWDELVNRHSPQAFDALLRQCNIEAKTAPLTQWNTTDVYSASHGILAYFADGELSELEIRIPVS